MALLSNEELAVDEIAGLDDAADEASTLSVAET